MWLTVSDFPAKGSVLTSRQIVDLARLSDEVGIDRFAVTDFPFHLDCVTLMTACLEATDRLAVESLVTNPFIRMPDVAACTWATMAELSAGRAILGVAKGGGVPPIWVEPYGYDRPDARRAVTEFVQICRAMWSGQQPPMVGETIRSSGLALDFPLDVAVPILIAARGPKMLAVAARHADIVHIASPVLSEPYVTEVVATIHTAATEAGRATSDYEVDLTVSLSVLADGRLAERLGKITTASAILWGARDRNGLPPSTGVPDDLVSALESGWDMWSGVALPDELADLIPPDVMGQFTIAGDPDHCLDELRNLIARTSGITGLRLKLPSLTGPDSYERLHEMIEHVGTLAAGLRRATVHG